MVANLIWYPPPGVTNITHAEISFQLLKSFIATLRVWSLCNRGKTQNVIAEAKQRSF